MEKSEMMKRYEAETGKYWSVKLFVVNGEEQWWVENRERNIALCMSRSDAEHIALLEAKANISDETIEAFLKIIRNQCDEISALKEKAAAYDRLMSGGKFTIKEMANIKKRPMTIDKDGTINAHGAIPHLSRGGFAGFSDCWVNDADDYAEIDESFVEIPEGLDWQTSLTLPDGWEEK